jgi:hypothetical protein
LSAQLIFEMRPVPHLNLNDSGGITIHFKAPSKGNPKRKPAAGKHPVDIGVPKGDAGMFQKMAKIHSEMKSFSNSERK